jgi:hypothetical protein
LCGEISKGETPESDKELGEESEPLAATADEEIGDARLNRGTFV